MLILSESVRLLGLWFLTVSPFVILHYYIIRILACQPLSGNFLLFFIAALSPDVLYFSLHGRQLLPVCIYIYDNYCWGNEKCKNILICCTVLFFLL